jgi:putative membrane protein
VIDAPVLAVTAVWGAYALAAARSRSRQGWPLSGALAFSGGTALVGIALSPGLDRLVDDDFSVHAAQHLILAMVAPLLLVLGSPVTLLLRTLPHPAARRVGALLNTAPAHVLTHPAVALLLSSGGLVVLYLTPVYELSTQHPLVHVLVHAHLLASGFLFASVVVGLDPAPRRVGTRTRLVVLGVSIAIHASVAQLLYAGLLVQVHEPVVQMQAAGSLMYFGGDLAELLLALALLVTARRTGSRAAVRRALVSPAHR